MDTTCCAPRFVKDKFGNLYSVRCGKCIYCLKQDQLDWVLRNKMELETFGNGYYVTLTYDDENLKELNVREVQLFLKKLRYHFDGVKIRVFYVGEYGRKSNRPHYHLLMYGLPPLSLHNMLRVCEELWNKGFCYVKYIENDNIHYVTKYLTKLDPRKHKVRPFVGCRSAPLLVFLISKLIPNLSNGLEIVKDSLWCFDFAMALVIEYLDTLKSSCLEKLDIKPKLIHSIAHYQRRVLKNALRKCCGII